MINIYIYIDSTHDSLLLPLEMNDLSAMYTFVMAIENAKIVAIYFQNIVTTSPMM